MKVLRSILEMRQALQSYRTDSSSIGLVPTMGALHEGHLSLLSQSLQNNQVTVCSIFVNPIQFNNPEDLKKYPRDEKKDFELLEKAGCDMVFVPSSHEMYQDDSAAIKMNFGEIENVLEGKFRPGHFSGVGVVVSKLFNIVQPDKAYFGQKDLQQLAVIKQMVKALNFPIEVHAVPIMREDNGLAMSSRNQRLNEEERETASVLYKSMLLMKSALNEGSSIETAKQKATEMLAKNNNIDLEYMELVDADTMEIFENTTSKNALSICAAAYISGVRIIDNLYIH
ncbi:pantoate--beta-alanine ligase [Reichenbachiella ulvae]|uniref:Pantothenate synthetase n=1 Tax=Reichenbachiella ulvae TaxID=2980104 RepID=A0ABT3CW34_9BACT|nr:pantoate--beta-alanine ligase [Reichenbachiella ulvae]MCV9387903.1 pantoate--beta-alanine ligase [Reichenbachiella ulvae]